MDDNPFKDEEPMSVFKDTPAKEVAQQNSAIKQDNHQESGEYNQFPKWDLLPPSKLIKRGKRQ
ncbi:hypothetical protein MK805_14825 [Shimazuella sp. AN120528]|uniref:hypothetical protein n=1 Tax=Shimazuella soli TaxID=1892854 RepID=UPI001F0F0682|nr:hypothetical protein [Shimazuella soli]MCH5586214.1 hypothetical protein [Shimazuella soli]